jgi:hypothetical protein
MSHNRGYVPLSVAVKHRTEIRYMEDDENDEY